MTRHLILILLHAGLQGEKNEVAINVISQHIRGELARRSNPTIRTHLSKAVPDTPRTEDPPVPQMQGLSISPWGVAAGAEAMARSRSSEPWSGSANGQAPNSDVRFTGVAEDPELHVPDTVHVLPQTSQLRGLMTIIHDETTEGEEYIFHVDRVARLVVEAAMSLLPYRSKTVKVVTGSEYVGKEIDVENICSVSILRSGGVFEKVREC